MELGFVPSLITGEKTGLWCALTLSSMVTIIGVKVKLRGLSTEARVFKYFMVGGRQGFFCPPSLSKWWQPKTVACPLQTINS